MNKILLALLFLSFQMSFSNDMIWSKTGHRVTGEIAEQHLTKKAKKAINKLLDGKSLAEASIFGDQIKAERKYRKFSAWHYVNFPSDKKYGDVEPSEFGDLMTGIEECIAIVKDEKSSQEDKAFYLKLLVHLVGDLHQPMHVGRIEDKGGNTIQVQWFSRGSNLHRVWDAHMIEEHGLSYSELASSLPSLTKAQIKFIQRGTIYDWVEKTQDISNKVYDSVEMGEKLSYRYNYDWWETAEDQLQKAGLRIAKILNEIYK